MKSVGSLFNDLVTPAESEQVIDSLPFGIRHSFMAIDKSWNGAVGGVAGSINIVVRGGKKVGRGARTVSSYIIPPMPRFRRRN